MLDDTVSDTEPITPQQTEKVQEENQIQVPPPPVGDSEKAEKYLRQLINLIDQNKIKVSHTDLKKFDLASIQDHYRMDLGEYEVEVNHSKEPNSGQDFYVLLFNNLKKIEEGGESYVNKVILAYTHLTQAQFLDFKKSADDALERIKEEEERKRFKEAMLPIDGILSGIASASPAEEIDIQDATEIAKAPEEDLADFEDIKPQQENQNFNDNPKASDFQNQSSSGL